MTIAEKLRSEGYGKPEFTKNELMELLVARLKTQSSVTFVLSNYVSTSIGELFISKSNPANRPCLLKWIDEEEFRHESKYVDWGREYIKIYL